MFRIVDQHLDFNGLAPMIRASGDFKNRTGDDPAVFMHFECDGDSDFDLRQFDSRQIHDRKQLIIVDNGDQRLPVPDRFKFTRQQLFNCSVERRLDGAESQLKQRIRIIDLGGLVALGTDFRIQFRL